MLAADKSALERDLRLQMLTLQWKELEYLHTNFQNLAVSSSVLVGFGFTALGFDTTYHPEHGTDHSSIWELNSDVWSSNYFILEVIFQAMFTTSAALALGYNLLALFIATIASMCGPGMALRGPEGSVCLAVRHMEQQLKRSLRFFGRGVIAIVMTLATVGLRNFQDIGFLGGIITLFIGIWAMHAIWSYGTEIAEKFYVSPDRAVRGTFVYGPNGSNPIWTHTAEERAELENRRKKRPRIANMWKARWRPDGHGISTPLWRLDKMIAFPYHDEDRLRNSEGTSNPDRRAQGERQQMANLVLNAQGPIASVRMRGESTSDGGGFDPIGLATYVHDAVMGTVGAENDSPKGRNRRQSKDGDRLLARNKKGAVELTSRR